MDRATYRFRDFVEGILCGLVIRGVTSFVWRHTSRATEQAFLSLRSELACYLDENELHPDGDCLTFLACTMVIDFSEIKHVIFGLVVSELGICPSPDFDYIALSIGRVGAEDRLAHLPGDRVLYLKWADQWLTAYDRWRR